jgi:hypothetical protein
MFFSFFPKQAISSPLAIGKCPEMWPVFALKRESGTHVVIGSRLLKMISAFPGQDPMQQ